MPGPNLEVAVPVEQLSPDLWDATFAEDTLVRPFVSPDRSKQRAQSWPYRLGMSLLKSVYPTTGIVHHDLEGFSHGDQQTPLQEVLAGLDVRWDPDRADAMRARHGKTMKSMVTRRRDSREFRQVQLPPTGACRLVLEAVVGQHSLRHRRAVFSLFHPPVDRPLAD